MRAVDREDLKLVSFNSTHPAGDVGGRSIPGACKRISILGNARRVFRKICEWTERYPRLERAIGAETREDVAEHGDRDRDCGDSVE